ncbi:MAG TPA: hypothetical protein VMU41_16175 [Candidatus Binataceae bacterium]|nr:hypothetical protein [Candidatus Binataceae bacterium]
MLIGSSKLAGADEVPDPCKLLSENDVQNTLGITGPVAMEPNPVAPPIARPRVVDRGTGNVGLAMPVSSSPRTNTLVCGGRAGSVQLSIGVTALPQAKLDEEEDRSQMDLLERKEGFKVETTNYGNTNCREILKPAADMLGRGAQLNNLVVAVMGCSVDRSGWQVGVVAKPWTPKKNPPFSTDKPRALTELAAQRLPPVPPTAAQNVTTTSAGVPAGFMQ